MHQYRYSRREFIKALGLIGGLSGLGLETALADACQELAGKRLRWIVPNRPGGGYDTYSRMIAPHLGTALGANVVVENILGAGGMVGSAALRDAKPDGLTVGILDASGMLGAALAGEEAAPNPSTDFTILGRIARSQHVWATGRDSSLKTIDDVFRTMEQRPIVFGVRDVGSTSFLSISIGSFLLDIDHEIVAGFSGSGATALAAVRGDVDLISNNFGSIFKHIEAGDVRPLLQISDGEIAPHRTLDRVPVVGGDKGLAARRAAQLGQDPEAARDDVAALIGLVGAGRLVAAPLNLQEHIQTCLEQALYTALTDPAFQDKAATNKLSLDIARAPTAIAALRVVNERIAKFLPVIQQSIRSVRN
ncbi:MAG: tripartite tricarboxylate transporter substrate-binding protein [Gammaproteobacteria bacterium]|nr:tripartite tricarboxylate transporter substrate-binding protein [Gammaproteobacteria bacterium]